MKEKIEEICRRLSGEVPCNKPCAFGVQEHSVSEYECAMCCKSEILALIEQENAGMREALIEARAEIERLSVVTGYEGEGHFKVLAKIDAVLGGS